MTRFLFILLALFPLVGKTSVELKVGDVLLQPLKCWTCSLIEAEEGSIYSHMGLVLEVHPEVKVAESLGSVKLIPLKEFLQKTESGQRVSVRRFKEKKMQSLVLKNERELIQHYYSKYDGLQYDSEFLWDNFDEHGNEKLYCSEMITKLLMDVFKIELPMKRMRYVIKREEWIQYFRGLPPDGKWGNSPADFEKSPLFVEIGEL